jgi:hypothetical protein
MTISEFIITVLLSFISGATLYGAYDMLKQINKIEDSEN